MTFKLNIGDRLVREDRTTSPKSGSDLVRDFRQRMRAEAAASRPDRAPQAGFAVISPRRPRV
jgi:hypothetical protein